MKNKKKDKLPPVDSNHPSVFSEFHRTLFKSSFIVLLKKSEKGGSKNKTTTKLEENGIKRKGRQTV